MEGSCDSSSNQKPAGKTKPQKTNERSRQACCHDVMEGSCDSSSNQKPAGKTKRQRTNERSRQACCHDVMEGSCDSSSNQKPAGKTKRRRTNERSQQACCHDVMEGSCDSSSNLKPAGKTKRQGTNERSRQACCHDVMEGSCDSSSNQKPAGKTKRRRTNERLWPVSPGGFSLGSAFTLQDPRGPGPGAFQSSTVGGPISTTASRRESTDIPCCTVPPTFHSAPRKYNRKGKLPGKGSVLQQNVALSCNLACGVSNRTLSHPSFQSYYTAVARWGSGSKKAVRRPWNTCKKSSHQQKTDGERSQSVLAINSCDFFYTDPQLLPGHRVYNCLSSRSQKVFKNFRLDTPAPIMSVCESPTLTAVKPAGHAEEHTLDGKVNIDDGAPHRGEKKTKWLSLAEYNALIALLDMPHHKSADCADYLPLSKPILWIPGQVPDISTPSSSASQVKRGDTLARDCLGFGFSSSWNTLHSQDQDHHKIRIPDVWNASETSTQGDRTMDMHIPQMHITAQRNQVTPVKSSHHVNTNIGFPPCQSTRKQKVKSHEGNEHFGDLTPMYQLKVHYHKKHEPSERINANKITGTTETTELLVTAAGCRSDQYSVQENDAAMTMLELHYLLPVDKGASLSAEPHLYVDANPSH